MAGYWLKLYTEILDDPKYHRLSEPAKIGMIELMIVAKKIDHDGELPSIDDICFYTRRSLDWWTKVLDELQAIEFIVSGEGAAIIRKFSERQKAVNDAERQKRSREIRHKKEFSHESVTEPSRIVTENRKDVDVEKETEKETDADVVPACAGNVDNAGNSWVRQDVITQFEQISKLTAPINQSKIMDQWFKALARLIDLGVTPEIMRQACEELTAKKYRIAGPWSIEKPCQMILAERKRETIPKTARKLDSEGQYAEFINH